MDISSDLLSDALPVFDFKSGWEGENQINLKTAKAVLNEGGFRFTVYPMRNC